MKEIPTEPSNRRSSSIIPWVAIILSVVAVTFSSINFFSGNKKIAYVRSSELIYGYAGMKEAEQTMKEKMQQWQTNVDTLQTDYDRSLTMYNQGYASYSKEEHNDRRQFLQKQQENLEQYKQAIETKAQEEQQQITQGVLNQINSFVAEYGKKHGYEMIFGTTSSGNLLYGNNAIDITKELLAELNSTYKRKP